MSEYNHYRNDPESCGHGGTIHLGHGYKAEKQCKICGAKFDGLGNQVEP